VARSAGDAVAAGSDGAAVMADSGNGAALALDVAAGDETLSALAASVMTKTPAKWFTIR
jgi:hypothetical protein